MIARRHYSSMAGMCAVSSQAVVWDVPKQPRFPLPAMTQTKKAEAVVSCGRAAGSVCFVCEHGCPAE